MSRLAGAFPRNISHVLPSGTVVREARETDLANVLSLLAQMHEEDEPLAPSSEVQALFSEILAANNRLILVAEKSGILVATLDLFVLSNLTRGGRPWAGIENMVVDAEQRRQGIGRGILDFAVGLAKDVGCYKVQLISHDRRDAAQVLYEAAGFTAPVRGFRLYVDV